MEVLRDCILKRSFVQTLVHLMPEQSS